MYRAHIHLVELIALDSVEWVVVHRRLLITAVVAKAQGLKPRVAVELDAVKLIHLALEGVELLMYGSERCQALLGVVVGLER